ncbi:right-handed parallel beta-helix repeat-containing protein [Algisphaera agarilytica]|uniref:Right handed beta helix domain-containing protein n=1 Tax=Algisphaera agarilytica TaxID=1385975 RepID=A0A7X0H703_9BACT|nr:right-handed parallel beta-helix repeat-containing protein [Algisphaera agarilytica]MBB6430437.1 hypothetical protein [Algisphaera agarilytica]
MPQRSSGAVMCLLAALLMVFATPAAGNVTIEGVTKGQVVTGEIEVSATSSASRLVDLILILTGPEGTELISRSTTPRVHLVADPANPMKGMAWDSTQAASGKYTLVAYSTSRQRTGRKVESTFVNFTVDNPAPQPVATPAVDEPVVEEPVVETPVVEERQAPVAQLPTGDEAAGNGQADEPEVTETETPELVEAVKPVVPQVLPSPTVPQDEVVEDATVAFAADTPAERVIGDTASVKIEVANAGANADVLFLVWDLGKQEVVPGISATMDVANPVVPASLLDRLPVGNMELQAHYREGGKIVMSAKQAMLNTEPVKVDIPSGPSAMPTVRFSDNLPTTYTRGSGQGLSFEVASAMPAKGDVLAIAWSIDEGRLVPGFAQVYTQGPWTITSDLLDLLPDGVVEVQLRPRYDGKIIGKVVHSITVKNTVVAEIPKQDDPTDNGGETGAETPGDETQADTGEEITAEVPVIDATPEPEAPSVPSDAGPVEVAFSADTPSRYTQGSGDSIALDLQGSLPAGGDVLMLMWHKDRSEMVTDFAHELSGSSLQVSNSKLDAAPAGNVELQALLRVPGEALVIRKRSIYLVDPNAPEEEQVPEDTGNDYGDLNLTSAGFTQFTKSADTRVIYVAANGNDNNDGLSPATPMRTGREAYKKLRHGKPDWLLFKAGDTFRGNLGTISKSGRSANEPMLIGAYGDGPRPVMLSPNGTWAEKFFQTNGDYVSFVGLHIIAENRDYTRSGFNASAMTQQIWNAQAITFLGDSKGLLIEDCIMEYFKFAIVVQSNKDNGYARDAKIRRNAILNSYGHWNKAVAGHSSGIFGAYLDGLLIEENVLDHNGWTTRVSGAGKTKFNHNIYVQDNCTGNSLVRGNIITNGSAHGMQLRSGGDVIDNLFVGNPLAFFVGRYESDVLSNVVLKSQDLGPGEDVRGHGIEILPCLNARVQGNIVSQKQGSADFAYAIGFNYEPKYVDFLNGRPFKASLTDNKIYKWPRSQGRDSAIKFGTQPQMTANARNALDKASGGASDPPWIDPERDVESYMKSIGKSASLDALVQAAAFRPRGQWAKEFSANAVNTYIRRGFDVQPFD